MIVDAPKSKINQDSLHFWVGLWATQSIQDQLSAEQKEVLHRCLVHPASVRFEKLRGYDNVYSVRYSKKGRIILTQADHKLIVLALLPDHNYKKALRQLSQGVLSRFKRQGNTQALDFKPCDQAPFESEPSNGPSEQKINYKKVAFEKQWNDELKILVLDQDQEAALHTSMPAIISGMPGSGKTTIAKALVNIAKTLKPGQKLLYTTKSKSLVQQIANDIAQEIKGFEDKVVLRDYDSLMGFDAEKIISEQQVLGLLAPWLKKHRKALIKQLPGNDAVKAFATMSPQMVHQEFRLISGYLDEYLNLSQVGKKQSLVTSREVRQRLLDAYKAFQHTLDAQGVICPDFTAAQGVQGRFEVILLDEGQDLSPLQFLELLKLLNPKSKKVCVLFGDGQCLHDDLPNKMFINNQLNALGKVNLCTLKQPYRCPESVIQVAKKVNQLRLAATPKNKQEAMLLPGRSDTKSEGGVHWRPLKALKQVVNALKTNVNQCIVGEPEDLDWLHTQYNIPRYQLFTYPEIKGLQYARVILFKPFAKKEFHELNKLLDTCEGDLSAFKAEFKKTEFAIPLSELFVGMTRAQEELILLSDSHFKALNHYLEKSTVVKSSLESQYAESPQEDQSVVLNKAHELMKQGMFDKATELLKERLGWSTFETQRFQETHGFAPRTYSKKQSDKEKMEFQKAKEQLKIQTQTSSSLPLKQKTTTDSQHENVRANAKPSQRSKTSKKASSKRALKFKKKVQTNTPAALTQALEKDDATFIREYFQSHEFSQVIVGGNFDRSSMLAIALLYDSLQVVEALLELGADIHELDLVINQKPQLNALNHIICDNKTTVLDLLISRGFNLDRLYDGMTPLFMALLEDNLTMVEYLIKHGANPNTFIGSGKFALMSPVMYTIAHARTAALELLLDAGAILNPQYKEKSAANLISYWFHVFNQPFLQRTGAIVRKSFVDRLFDFKEYNFFSAAMLFGANEQLLELLIRHGVKFCPVKEIRYEKHDHYQTLKELIKRFENSERMAQTLLSKELSQYSLQKKELNSFIPVKHAVRWKYYQGLKSKSIPQAHKDSLKLIVDVYGARFNSSQWLDKIAEAFEGLGASDMEAQYRTLKQLTTLRPFLSDDQFARVLLGVIVRVGFETFSKLHPVTQDSLLHKMIRDEDLDPVFFSLVWKNMTQVHVSVNFLLNPPLASNEFITPLHSLMMHQTDSRYWLEFMKNKKSVVPLSELTHVHDCIDAKNINMLWRVAMRCAQGDSKPLEWTLTQFKSQLKLRHFLIVPDREAEPVYSNIYNALTLLAFSEEHLYLFQVLETLKDEMILDETLKNPDYTKALIEVADVMFERVKKGDASGLVKLLTHVELSLEVLTHIRQQFDRHKALFGSNMVLYILENLLTSRINLAEVLQSPSLPELEFDAFQRLSIQASDAGYVNMCVVCAHYLMKRGMSSYAQLAMEQIPEESWYSHEGLRRHGMLQEYSERESQDVTAPSFEPNLPYLNQFTAFAGERPRELSESMRQLTLEEDTKESNKPF